MEAILSRKRGRCGAWILPRTEQILHAAFYRILLNETESSLLFDKMSEEKYQNWNMWYLDISSGAAISRLISYRIHWKYRTENQLTSCKVEHETLRNPLNLETLKFFESFIEYRGSNNSQEIHGFPCKREHGNKNGDPSALRTFKTDFNFNVHLNVSHICKTKTKIFFKKKEKEVKINNIPRGPSGS